MSDRLFLTIATSLGALFLASISVAQGPPDISRWNNNTAIAPPQGYSLGSPLTLTWGFLRDGNHVDGGGAAGSNLINRFDATFGAGPGGSDFTLRPWYTYFQRSFDRWSQVSGLSYQYEAADDGATQNSNFANRGILGVRADLRIGGRNIDGSGGVLAYNFFPNGGDMVIDTGDMNFYGNSGGDYVRLRNVIMHEHGHGMGCAHCESNNAGFLMEPFIQTSFDGPQFHDILLAQRGYGDVYEKSNSGLGNDTFGRATSLGSLNHGDSVSIGNDARNLPVGPNEIDFVSIDSQTDTDFFSFSISSGSMVNVLLESLGPTYNVGPQNGSQVSFNTKARSDLTLSLFDVNGTSLLASSNVTGFGGNESLEFNLTSAGTYFLRVTGLNNPDSFFDTQMYGLSVVATVPEPATLAVLGLALMAMRRRKRS